MKSKMPVIIGCLVLASVLGTEAQTNLVQNGSFEVITVVPGVETRARPWFGITSYNENWDNAPDGVNYANITDVYQDISLTPGQSYTLSFWAAADLYLGVTATFDVRWGGTDVAGFITQPHPYDPGINRDEQIVWEHFTVPNLVAQSSLQRLEILVVNRDDGFLDDVRLVAVPEPSSVAVI